MEVALNFRVGIVRGWDDGSRGRQKRGLEKTRAHEVATTEHARPRSLRFPLAPGAKRVLGSAPFPRGTKWLPGRSVIHFPAAPARLAGGHRRLGGARLRGTAAPRANSGYLGAGSGPGAAEGGDPAP